MVRNTAPAIRSTFFKLSNYCLLTIKRSIVITNTSPSPTHLISELDYHLVLINYRDMKSHIRYSHYHYDDLKLKHIEVEVVVVAVSGYYAVVIYIYIYI